MILMRALLVFCLGFSPLAASAAVQEIAGLSAFLDEMATKHGFDRGELGVMFENVHFRETVISSTSRPLSERPWPDFLATFLDHRHVSRGLTFWQAHEDSLRRAERQYGVPAQVLVALIGVETYYGRRTGNYSTLDALTSLAFGHPRRAEFFRGELEQYLLLTREQGFDPLEVRGSFAGALGIPQFMPSNYRKLAVDFDGDGRVDILSDADDAIGSVANYLASNGWQRDRPVAERSEQPVAGARTVTFMVGETPEQWQAYANFDVIMTYNRSSYYAMAVYRLADALRAAHNGESVSALLDITKR